MEGAPLCRARKVQDGHDAPTHDGARRKARLGIYPHVYIRHTPNPNSSKPEPEPELTHPLLLPMTISYYDSSSLSLSPILSLTFTLTLP